MSIKKKFLLAGIFLLLLGISLGCCHAVLQHLEQRERQHCYGIAQSQLGYLTRQVESIFNTTRLLAERCVLPDGGVTGFDEGARGVMVLREIRALQLAPDGRIVYSYPPQPDVASLDLFSDPRQKADAIQSRDTGLPGIYGPYPLRQGGTALLCRLPVYRGECGNTFWGFAIAVIDMDHFLANFAPAFSHKSYLRYALFRRDGENGGPVRIAGCPYEALADPLEISSILPNGQWSLAIEPRNGWIPTWYTHCLYSLAVLTSVLLSALLFWLFKHIPQLAALTDMDCHDPLTHCLNRDSLQQDVNSWITSREKFCLISMGLTNFNALCEEFGYDVGERLLQTVTLQIRSQLPRSARLYRTGGAIFALLVEREATGPLLKALNLQLAGPLPVGSRLLRCHLALGIAQFPLDGHAPDTLLGKAEERRERDTREQRID